MWRDYALFGTPDRRVKVLTARQRKDLRGPFEMAKSGESSLPKWAETPPLEPAENPGQPARAPLTPLNQVIEKAAPRRNEGPDQPLSERIQHAINAMNRRF
jgi:hypothetical protein